jgi:hypothetical protein
MTFEIILDDATYSGRKLEITTKTRGKIIGIPHSVDFETEDDRLGYNIDVDEYTQDTVYLDEITEIITLPSAEAKAYIQLTAKLVSGD